VLSAQLRARLVAMASHPSAELPDDVPGPAPQWWTPLVTDDDEAASGEPSDMPADEAGSNHRPPA